LHQKIFIDMLFSPQTNDWDISNHRNCSKAKDATKQNGSTYALRLQHFLSTNAVCGWITFRRGTVHGHKIHYTIASHVQQITLRKTWQKKLLFQHYLLFWRNSSANNLYSWRIQKYQQSYCTEGYCAMDITVAVLGMLHQIRRYSINKLAKAEPNWNAQQRLFIRI